MEANHSVQLGTSVSGPEGMVGTPVMLPIFHTRAEDHLSPPRNLENAEDEAWSELDPSLRISGNQHLAGQKDWGTSLFPNGKPVSKFKLRFIPPSACEDSTVGVCSESAVVGELVILDMTLVGFFLGKKPSFSFVKSALIRQEIMQLVHGGFAFRFTELEDRDVILDGNVYFIGGQPMFLRQWDRNLHTGGILGLRKVPLWVTLPGLPLHLWGEEALSSICSVIGNPLYSDRTTAMKTRLMFVRVCIEFSGDRPLLESIDIEDELGMKYKQEVKFEWKPPQCISCGVFWPSRVYGSDERKWKI